MTNSKTCVNCKHYDECLQSTYNLFFPYMSYYYAYWAIWDYACVYFEPKEVNNEII